MKTIKKSELKRLINECVQQTLNEKNNYSEQHDFSRQVCEWTKEKAQVIGVDKKELAKNVVNMMKQYFSLKE